MTLPQWLTSVLADSPRARPPSTAADIAVGDVRIAEPMDGPDHGERRPVLVLEVEDPPMFAQVALLTPELDLAGARDVLLDGSADDLPYSLLVELDALGPVFTDQLGALLGRVDPAFVEALAAAPSNELEGIPGRLTGIPVTRRDDPRWLFKRRELEILRLLTGEALAELLEGPITVLHPALWEELLAGSGRASCEPRDRLARVLTAQPLAPVSSGLAARLSGECQRLSARLGRDGARVVCRHLMRSLRAPDPGAGNALKAREVAEDLAQELGEVAARERRAATVLVLQGQARLPAHFRARGPHGYLQVATQTLQ